MSEMKRHLVKVSIVLLSSILIGYMLLVFAYLIPTDLMQEQVTCTAEMMETTVSYPEDSLSGRVIDNYADSLTVLMASYPGIENAFEKAACNYYESIEGEYPRESLVGIVLHGREHDKVAYGRYWHGSMLFIKPLLLFHDLGTMRILNTVVLFLLVIAVLITMRRSLPGSLLPFVLFMLLLGPTAVGQCFEYTFAVHIMLVTCIIYLWNPVGIVNGYKCYYLFLFSGILLAYFDFLTAPTITLTVPLVLLCLKEKPACKKLLICTGFWIIGYAGMWAGKWVIALTLNGSSFSSLTDHFALWTSRRPVSGNAITRAGTLNKNFEMLFNNLYVDLALLFYCIVLIIQSVRKRKNISIDQIYGKLSLFYPALIGILWILVMARHSNVHTFFTYRTLAPCILCILYGLDLGNVAGRLKRKG